MVFCSCFAQNKRNIHQQKAADTWKHCVPFFYLVTREDFQESPCISNLLDRNKDLGTTIMLAFLPSLSNWTIFKPAAYIWEYIFNSMSKQAKVAVKDHVL